MQPSRNVNKCHSTQCRTKARQLCAQQELHEQSAENCKFMNIYARANGWTFHYYYYSRRDNENPETVISRCHSVELWHRVSQTLSSGGQNRTTTGHDDDALIALRVHLSLTLLAPHNVCPTLTPNEMKLLCRRKAQNANFHWHAARESVCFYATILCMPSDSSEKEKLFKGTNFECVRWQKENCFFFVLFAFLFQVPAPSTGLLQTISRNTLTKLKRSRRTKIKANRLEKWQKTK